MMRSIVFAAPVVCRLESNSCPVSAAVIATSIVSLSRISPSKITSGAFAQCTAQSGDVARAVAADLTLAHNALIVAMDVLHRILERQNMSRARTVDLVDDTRERCGLTAAR